MIKKTLTKKRDTEQVRIGPKTLVLDIETAPIQAKVWALWKQNIGLNMIDVDWYILSFSAKFTDEKKIHYHDQQRKGKDNYEDDKDLLLKLWDLLDKADFVVAHNGRKFDLPKINTRFIISGMRPPSPYKIIDTLDIAKRVFNFTSNKLEYLTDKLCKVKKLKHKDFPGFELWAECLKGNKKAWKEMKEYNIQDTLSLEELFHKMKHWYPTLPSFAVYQQLNVPTCTVCGSSNIIRRGYKYTNVGKFQRYICKDCGGYSRSRYSEYDRTLKPFLLTNNA